MKHSVSSSISSTSSLSSLIGKRVNYGAGYGQEIPVNFIFLEPAKAIQWAENAVKKSYSKYRPESKTL